MNCSDIKPFVNSLSLFTSRLITSNCSSILFVSRVFFTWVVLSDAYLCLSPILVTNDNAVEGGTTSAAWSHQLRNQSIRFTDGVTVTSLSAGLQHKTSAARNLLCHIALNQTLRRKFEKLYNSSSRVKEKWAKRTGVKNRPACILKELVLRIQSTLYESGAGLHLHTAHSFRKGSEPPATAANSQTPFCGT